MTCISRQNVGKYTYLYESVSFRDQNGRPRNKKVSIGKIDPVQACLSSRKNTLSVWLLLERQLSKKPPPFHENP